MEENRSVSTAPALIDSLNGFNWKTTRGHNPISARSEFLRASIFSLLSGWRRSTLWRKDSRFRRPSAFGFGSRDFHGSEDSVLVAKLNVPIRIPIAAVVHGEFLARLDEAVGPVWSGAIGGR